MAEGPGKYDEILTTARDAARAEGAILIIYKGKWGDGFSAQLPPEVIGQIPTVLRQIADGLEERG